MIQVVLLLIHELLESVHLFDFLFCAFQITCDDEVADLLDIEFEFHVFVSAQERVVADVCIMLHDLAFVLWMKQ